MNEEPEGDSPVTLLLLSCAYCCIVSGVIKVPFEKNCLWDCSCTSDSGFGGKVLLVSNLVSGQRLGSKTWSGK